MPPNPTRYFVLRLHERDYRPTPEACFVVQLPSPEGGPGATGYLRADQTELVVDGEAIPTAVLNAARRQPYGKGDYVNEKGESIPPF